MEKKSGKRNKITLWWLVQRLVFSALPWVVLIWFATTFVIANNSVVLNAVPLRANVQDLERQLKDEEKPGADLVKVQKTRARLILEYIDKNQLVKAREQLMTYKNWLETNTHLSLDDRIEQHKQLSIIYTSLGEFEPAVNEYTLILQDLAKLDDAESRIRKARFLNNRGVANFLLSQGSEKDELRQKYQACSIEDLRASQQLTESQSKAGPNKESKDALGYIDQIVKENENCLDLEMTFTPTQAKP